MNKALNPVMRLDSGRNTNWSIHAQPVAILNEASTLHERIGYCWGLAHEMMDLSSVLLEHQSQDVARTSGLFFNQLTLLADVLHRLGAETNTNGGAQ